MQKDITITFQTNADIQSVLEKIAEEECQSLSSIVEAIIYQYLKTRRGFAGIIQNRRRYARKEVRLTAFIGNPLWHRKEYVKGTVLDISLGGIRFSIPKGTKLEIKKEEPSTNLNIIFTLPNNFWGTNVKCHPNRVLESSKEFQVGAVLDNDFSTCLALQKYLI